MFEKKSLKNDWKKSLKKNVWIKCLKKNVWKNLWKKMFLVCSWFEKKNGKKNV